MLRLPVVVHLPVEGLYNSASATVVVLHLQGRLSRSQLMISAPDALLGVLFFIGFYMTREVHPS